MPKGEDCYLHKLKLAPFDALENFGGRKQCPKCKLSKKYYCPTCYICLADEKLVPHVTLPLHVSVLQHPKEKPERSSIIAAKIISPEFVDIYRNTELPSINLDPKKTLFLYPTKEAKTLKEMGKEAISGFSHLVMIDSTWGQVQTFLRLPQIKALPAVKISAESTTFWRYQSVDSTNLATVEALYFFFKEYDECLNGGKDYVYDGKYDNLLYYYTFNYNIIQERYVKEGKDVRFVLFTLRSLQRYRIILRETLLSRRRKGVNIYRGKD